MEMRPRRTTRTISKTPSMRRLRWPVGERCKLDRLAATNKSLAQNSKSRTGANATNRAIKPGNGAKTMARVLRRCVPHHEKTGCTNEILRQSDPDSSDLHRHLLGLHGAAAGACSPSHNGRNPSQQYALV